VTTHIKFWVWTSCNTKKSYKYIANPRYIMKNKEVNKNEQRK